MPKETFVFKSKVRVAISSVCNLRCRYCDNSQLASDNRTSAMEDFRVHPLSEGCISTVEYLDILQAFFRNGFTRINLTGGEPMMNPDWDLLATGAKQIGFESVEMTTNGTLIRGYINKNNSFPSEIDRLIVSLDTCDPEKYDNIVGKQMQFSKVVEGMHMLKHSNPNIKLTANCVLCQSSKFEIEEYIEFIVQLGFDSVTFLDLIVRDKKNKKCIVYFMNEFLSGSEIKQVIKDLYGELVVSDERHEYNVVLPNGLKASVVDTQGLTRRDERCDNCTQYCQEGYYTAKIATDGTIIDCLAGTSIDARSRLQNGNLDVAILELYDRLANGKQGYHFDRFYQLL